jgi:hypothetical protein
MNGDAKCKEIPEILKNTYGKDMNIPRLETQLAILPDLLTTAKRYDLSLANIKTVTKMNTLASLLKAVPSYDILFSEIHSLLSVYFTLPISTATADKFFCLA